MILSAFTCTLMISCSFQACSAYGQLDPRKLPCYVAPVYNASSPFNDINRCDTELQQLECHLPKLKLCVAVKNEGSLMAVCTYNICLTGYACPVVTKATSSALYVEAIEGLCKHCKYADNIEDRLKNYNSVGSECLAFSSTSPLPIMQSSSPSSISTKEPSVSPGTNSSPSNGPITKELPVTICVITLGILAVFLLT